MDYRTQGRLFAGIEQFGDAVALVQTDGTKVSYRELAKLADSLAEPLGEQKRLLVSIQMQNDLTPIALYVGALRVGHVVIPCDGGAGARSIARTFAANAEFDGAYGAWSLDRLSDADVELHPDLAVLLSTSGSTGSPKLVRLSHQNLRSNAEAIADYLAFQPGERAITSLPAYYSYGLSVLHSHLLLGHTIVLNDSSVADEAFQDTIDREGITSIAGVPHSYELLLRSGFFEQRHPSLRYLTQAGGKLPADRIREVSNWAADTGKRFYVMYGQTEASPRMAYLPPSAALDHPDCIGLPIPGGSFRLEPMESMDGLPERAGELVYSGPNVMMGYATSTADLAAPQGSDTLHTGDVAVRDPSGYYRIVGRISRFAKLFGLRLSFDTMEQRLVANGISAAVSGDDSGVVVASTTSGSRDRIVDILSNDLGIPPSYVFAVEVDDLPRLPTGKVDYIKLRALRPDDIINQSDSLVAAIAGILGLPQIDPKESFASLGGDSLNFVQVMLAVEAHLGRAPASWESTPIGELERMPRAVKPNTAAGKARPPLSILAFDAARSAAILFALLAHTFTQTQFVIPSELQVLPRMTTPMLILLFGAMIPLLHIPRSTHSSSRDSLQQYLSKAMQCYCLFALNIGAIWLTEPAGWKYALASLAFLGSTPYAQILVFYTILFLLIPAILYLLKRFGVWVLFLGSVAVHLAFIPLKMVPEPPLLGGQPVIQRLLDLWVGAGSVTQNAGPSIAHSFVLVMAGCLIGLGLKRATESANPMRAFIRQQAPVITIFALGSVLALFIPNYPVNFSNMVTLELRNLNHPAYVFMYGGLNILVVCVLLMSPLTNKIPSWFLAIGHRSLFAFGIGNAVIALWPDPAFPMLAPGWNAMILFSVVLALIYYYDYCMRAGRHARWLPRWVYDATRYGERKIRSLAGIIASMLALEKSPRGRALDAMSAHRETPAE